MIGNYLKNIKVATIIEKDSIETLKVESKKYILYLILSNTNSLRISFVPNNKEKNNEKKLKQKKIDLSDITHTKNISDLSSIDNYFKIFKNNVPLLYKHLKKLFTSNLFSVDYNNINDEIITINLLCLQENKNKLIEIKLSNVNAKKKYKSKSVKSHYSNNIIADINIIPRDKHINLSAGPVCNNKKNWNNPNDNKIYFYYKAKNKNMQYYIYINKNEYIINNYKEIVFKIVEKENDLESEYCSYMNLIDFFDLSESYFYFFKYSIDDIYDDLLVIFSNHNYKIEKIIDKNKIRLIFNIINIINNKSYYHNIFISINKKYIERGQDEINYKINNYFCRIPSYIIKFGDNLKDKNIKKLINNPNENNVIITNNKNENENKEKIKFNAQNNNDLNTIHIENKIGLNNSINLRDNTQDFIKKDKDNSKESINKKHNIIIENDKIIINKTNISLNFDDCKNIINKNGNENNNDNKDDNKNNNENKELINEINENFSNQNDNSISLNEEEKEKNIIILKVQTNNLNGQKEEKENLNFNSNIKIKNEANPPSNEKLIFLKQKRNFDNLSYNIIYNSELLSLSLEQYLNKRKRISENKTLLNDKQLQFIIDKVEKNIPEFRLINLQIKVKIEYEIKPNLIKDDNVQNIIDEFYKKSNNIKNLIFLIKTSNNKLFGGFTQIGFKLNKIRNKNELFSSYNDSNAFIFSLDKMKIFDLIQKNNDCIFCNNERLPQFKDQIMFEKNNIKIGYTGKKNVGFLVDNDYELNSGEKKFNISQIELISIYTL